MALQATLHEPEWPHVTRRSRVAWLACAACCLFVWSAAGCASDTNRGVDRVQRITLRGTDAAAIGIVISAAACDDDLYVAEASGALWRLRTGTHDGQAARLSVTGEAHLRAVYAIALDCETATLYALDPITRRVVAIDRHTAAYQQHWSLPVEAEQFTIPAGRLTVLPGSTIAIAGLSFGDTPDRTVSKYYEGLKLALLLDVTSGAWRTAVDPFDESCTASCTETAMSSSSQTVAVTLPTAPRVGLYDEQLRLARVVDVSSPGFLRDLDQPSAPLTQQAGILWGRTNSSVRVAWVTGDHLRTVHSLNAVDENWTPGSALVQWRQFLNVHTLSGRPVVLDQPLVGYYIGHTRSQVVTADYGELRQRSAPAVDIVLTSVPAE